MTNAPWKSNKEVDPNYPFWTRLNEAGEIVYSVPLEAPTEIPVDESKGAEQHEYSYLPIFGGKNLRVYRWETTDKEWAYRIRSWINTQHTQNRRYEKRFTVVEEVLGDGTNDGNHKVTHRSDDESEEWTDAGDLNRGMESGYEQYNWPDVEKQALDRIELETIRELVISKNPRSWEIFSQIRIYGKDVKTVAKETGISVQRVYQLINKVRDIARDYRKEQ